MRDSLHILMPRALMERLRDAAVYLEELGEEGSIAAIARAGVRSELDRIEERHGEIPKRQREPKPGRKSGDHRDSR